MFGGATLLFVATMALLAWSVAARAAPRRVAVRAWILGGGLALPIVVLGGPLPYSHWRATSAASRPAGR